MTRLHVNIDHIATVRNARGTAYPDPSEGARLCLEADADGITAHLREDRRHIVDADLPRLRAVTTEFNRVFNLEMAATDEMMRIAGNVKPDLVTFVPERREERTTEGGLDAVGLGAALGSMVKRLGDSRIRTSLFIAPDEAQVQAAKALGATMVEFHTGHYAEGAMDDLPKLERCAKLAASLGLGVAAGHGLTRANVRALMKTYPFEELNIGHALIADAIFLSLREAVLEMRAAIQ